MFKIENTVTEMKNASDKFISTLNMAQGKNSLILENILICSCCSVTKPCLTLCNLMDCNIPGFPVLHYLLKFA